MYIYSMVHVCSNAVYSFYLHWFGERDGTIIGIIVVEFSAVSSCLNEAVTA